MRFDTACVDKHKMLAEPFAVAVDSVSCDAGGIIDYRKSCTHKLVEKCRFTDVGSADNRNNITCHIMKSLL